jgi:hypothetical protein
VSRLDRPSLQVPGLAPGRRFDRLIAARCAILAAPPARHEIGFICSCFVRFTLPHSLMSAHTLERRNGNQRVTFMAPPSIGLPYGKVARLLLIHFTTLVVRGRCRDIELGLSMAALMDALCTTSTGGARGTIPMLKAQLIRLLALTTTVTLLDDKHACLTNAPLSDEFEIHWAAVETDRRSGLPARVRIGERMFSQMLTSAVPVDMRAVRALQQSALALDLYLWTTYRAPRVAKSHPARIAWSELAEQFGAAYARETDFKIAFRHALAQVQAVYPRLDSRLTETHFELHRSPPSVPRKDKS